MGKYLLTLTESHGEIEHLTKHVIEASNHQMVKYHFHRTLKDWGYRDSQFGKHCLEGHHGTFAEIHSIERLDWEEYQILSDYITSWTKV